jgi:hypothetical protein
MNFKKYIEEEKKTINDLFYKIKNVKNYNFLGNSISIAIFSYITIYFMNWLNTIGDFQNNIGAIILSGIIVSSGLWLILMAIFEKYSFIFKNKNIEKNEDFYFFRFYNKKEKEEIRKYYENLNTNSRKSTDFCLEFYNNLDINQFLENLISQHILNNNITQYYKEIIIYIFESKEDIDKNALFRDILYKINTENPKSAFDKKDEISDFIFNSSLSDKQKVKSLSIIKKWTDSSTIDNINLLYKEIKNVKNPLKKIISI